jgi:hypothetical protein
MIFGKVECDCCKQYFEADEVIKSSKEVLVGRTSGSRIVTTNLTLGKSTPKLSFISGRKHYKYIDVYYCKECATNMITEAPYTIMDLLSWAFFAFLVYLGYRYLIVYVL